MDADHEELLSPDTFDERIVDIFRALLDTKLVEFRVEKEKDTVRLRPLTVYRNGVKTVRTTLDPLTSFRGVVIEDEDDPNLDPLKKAKKERDAKTEYYDYLQQFLYWFDARAEHWAIVEAERLPEVDISSDRLSALLEEVKALKQSLHSHTNRLDFTGAAAKRTVQPARYASQADMLITAAESVTAIHPEASRPSKAPHRSP